MDAARRELAAEIHAAASEHDAAQADRLDRYRILEPETAELLAVLVKATGARRLLELGTSIGYSTIWLADAAEAVGGTLRVGRARPRAQRDRARRTSSGRGWSRDAAASATRARRCGTAPTSRGT